MAIVSCCKSPSIVPVTVGISPRLKTVVRPEGKMEQPSTLDRGKPAGFGVLLILVSIV
jgi:hypothetical protein